MENQVPLPFQNVSVLIMLHTLLPLFKNMFKDTADLISTATMYKEYIPGKIGTYVHKIYVNDGQVLA